MPSNEPQPPPPADDSKYQTYYVVAGDMSSFDGDATVRYCQMVLASAQDSYEACDIARNALEDGLAPIAAFDRQELLAMVDTLASHPLAPGAAYNLSHDKTETEMAALR